MGIDSDYFYLDEKEDFKDGRLVDDPVGKIVKPEGTFRTHNNYRVSECGGCLTRKEVIEAIGICALRFTDWYEDRELRDLGNAFRFWSDILKDWPSDCYYVVITNN